MKALFGLVLAASLIIPALSVAAGAATPLTSAPAMSRSIILVEGGCGRDEHRNDRGYCRPNWREHEDRECPRGYHEGEHRRCWPN